MSTYRTDLQCANDCQAPTFTASIVVEAEASLGDLELKCVKCNARLRFPRSIPIDKTAVPEKPVTELLIDLCLELYRRSGAMPAELTLPRILFHVLLSEIPKPTYGYRDNAKPSDNELTLQTPGGPLVIRKTPESPLDFDTITELARAKLQTIAEAKERYLEAWVAETGLTPSESQLVIQETDKRTVIYVEPRRVTCGKPVVSKSGHEGVCPLRKGHHGSCGMFVPAGRSG